jgi:hypothetical protein
MSSTRTKRITRIVDQLEKLAVQAGALELTLANGGFLDNWLATLAAEIREKYPREEEKYAAERLHQVPAESPRASTRH